MTTYSLLTVATVSADDPLTLKTKRRLQMSKFRFTLQTLAIATFILAVTSLAQAQASRTWVSGVGDDANPCSRTAPCKTWAGAISKTAACGEIDALDPGGFGAVTITKSITLDGTGTFASILASLTTGIIVNAAATDVITIRGISINGFCNGIRGMNILQAKTVRALWLMKPAICALTSGIRSSATTRATASKPSPVPRR